MQVPWSCHTSLGRRAQQEDTRTAFVVDSGATAFGVFDGHGGSEVSSFLAQHAEGYVSRALAQHASEADALKAAFVEMDRACLPPRQPGDLNASQAGSTALLVLVDEGRLVCANCGDSRAVLARSGRAVELSRDHRADDADERARVQECGGCVLNIDRTLRVMGRLAVTRAIGDHDLQPYGVTPEPEVRVVDRQPDDEFLILATDGLWDVYPSQEAVDLARRCVARAVGQGANRTTACAVASRVLVDAALRRDSGDNVTVLVVDINSSNF